MLIVTAAISPFTDGESEAQRSEVSLPRRGAPCPSQVDGHYIPYKPKSAAFREAFLGVDSA